MADSIAQVLSQVQRWTSSSAGGNVSDTILLQRFIQQRDESAFAALVARHGAMVFRVCRRVLDDAQDAEDASQAAFLILARKAGSLRQPEALSGWLHGVARRVALKARTKSASHSASDLSHCEALPDQRPDPLMQLTARELLAILDEEVQRLPSAQRSAVVLCCLEGHTQEEAARILGWTSGSVKGRLERGRSRLQQRLARRGIALSAALAIVAVSRGVAASAVFNRSAVRAALGGRVTTPAAALADGVLNGMLLGNLTGVTALVLAITLAVSAAVALIVRQPAEDNQAAEPAQPAKADTQGPKVDALGDPLPDGVIARLGTLRFRHGSHIELLAFTADGKHLLSQGSDGVRIWESATGKQLRHLALDAGRVWGKMALSPDGKQLAVVGKPPPSPVQFWDVGGGKKTGTLGEQFYSALCFSPDGKWLAASPRSLDVELWDAAGRKKIRSWPAHQFQVWTAAFSADGRRLLTSGTEGKIRLWDVDTGRQLQEFTPAGWQPNVVGTPSPAVLAPDGKLLALIEPNERRQTAGNTVQWQALISLRDTATGRQVRQLECPTPEITPGYTRPFTALIFSPDGKTLLTGGPDAFIRVWDVATGKEQRRLRLEPGSPTVLAVSRDGQTLAAAMLGDMTIRVLDLARGEVATVPDGHLMTVHAAVLTPDGRTAVTGGLDDSLLVWDVATGRPRRRLQGHNSPVHSLWLAPDGRTVFSGGWDLTLREWDLATGKERRRLSADLPRTGIGKVFDSPDGKSFLTVDAGNNVRLFDRATGKERQRFQGPEWMHGCALTPDGSSLVAWSGDRKVRVWDMKSGRKLHEYPLPPEGAGDGPRMLGGEGPVSLFSAALSPDGRLLAIGSPYNIGYGQKQERYLLFKDLATGQDIRRIDNLPSDVGILAFSPDERMLAWSGTLDGSGGSDPAIRLMEVASGRERRRLAGHRGPLSSLVFTPDGQKMISGSSDTTALVWDLGGRFDPHAKQVALTASELDALWTDLAAEDAARTYRAIRKLAASPASSVPFLRQRFRPVPPVDEKRIARLIADLDSDDFTTRRKAVAELEKLAGLALPAYRNALAGKPSIETRRRLEELLEKAGPLWWDVSGEQLRTLRAMEVLELAGTPEAREVLGTLAGGSGGARLTKQAKAALDRLTNRGGN
jgi:RNA polymerase sigma factor (sigma-70 family)